MHIILFIASGLNLVLLFEGRPDLRWVRSYLKDNFYRNRKIEKGIRYLSMKVLSVISNVLLLVLISGIDQPESGFLNSVIRILAIVTPILSIIIILISRDNNFEGFKRTVTFTGISLVMLFFVFLIMIIWSIDYDLRKNIATARIQYPGKAEDALISYLSDGSHSPNDRNNVAIWTLGQLGSEKALPILKELYKNDPEGMTCKGRHNSMLCQRELHKAIVKIENKSFNPFSRLNK